MIELQSGVDTFGRPLETPQASACDEVTEVSASNGVDLRRAGDVNPLIFVANPSKSGDLRPPLAVGIRQVHAIGLCFPGTRRGSRRGESRSPADRLKAPAGPCAAVSNGLMGGRG